MVQKSEIKEPLKFQPILQSRIWGGDGLYRKLRKGNSTDQGIGESWELSDRPDFSTSCSKSIRQFARKNEFIEVPSSAAARRPTRHPVFN